MVLGIHLESRLSRFMQQLNICYNRYCKKILGFTGHLFEGRFKCYIIENDLSLLFRGKYIELNPVRARIVAGPEDFPFSSYRYYAFGTEDCLVTTSPAFINLSPDEEARRKIYRDFVVDEKSILENS